MARTQLTRKEIEGGTQTQLKGRKVVRQLIKEFGEQREDTNAVDREGDWREDTDVIDR